MPRKNTKTEGQQRAAQRRRCYATVVYPDSAPDGWREALSEQHVAAFVSPLHDKDENADGTPKKAHYHVLYMFDSPKDFDSEVAPLFGEIGAVGREKVQSKRGYARYMCHLDNPEKAQYSPEDVTAYAGADYTAVTHLPSDDLGMLKDIMEFARVNSILSFAHLIDVCAAEHDEWFNLIATSRGFIVKEYIKSMKWECDAGYDREEFPIVDPSTGEIAPEEDDVSEGKK